MEKNFWNLKDDSQRLYLIILGIGLMLTIGMGWKAYQETKLQNDNELVKNEAGEGAYEQELYACIEGMDKVSLRINVAERSLSEKEAEQIFENAIPVLEENLIGENESFNQITENLQFIETVPGMPVEVTWTGEGMQYFDSDGGLREDVKILEPLELKLTALLTCQNYSSDFERVILLYPREKSVERTLLESIEQAEKENPQNGVLILPKSYEGSVIRWKKPIDRSFFYIFLFSLGSILCLKIGRKTDEELEKKKRLEELEREYAQIVSKFSMLLTAGLSVKNAWERIVVLHRDTKESSNLVYREMNWACREMQKGVAELEVYEAFGKKTGLIHYKKLMALFITYKRRGGGNLLDAMNQEMMQAWEEKKRKTKQQGEKIGTKLLLPMMGMLTVVFIMILVPAFLIF